MPNIVYLNTAACGLVPHANIAAANAMYTEFETNSSARSEYWRFNEESRIRETIASFLNVPAKNIAMVPNFSWAMNGIVQSLHGTEKVLLYKHDFPSFMEPFRINKFDITWVDTKDEFSIDIDFVKDCITNNKVDIVALSHVQWGSGYKLDLQEIGELCTQHGVLFFVDATQSIGAIEIDLSKPHIDVFASSNYKWMNAGVGTGELYVSDSFLEKYPPVVAGFNSYTFIEGKPVFSISVKCYEPGHHNMFGLTILESAIKHKQELGLANIEEHNRKLCQLFLDGIKDLRINILGDYSMNDRAPIVVLKDENGLGDWIKQHNIVVTHRNGLLRVSMHYHNTVEDIMALVDCLKIKYS
jgi:selenocysteine lyase/cysteine desulfurase